jgi:regulation of enolase protein 1 (concanavalin A-like superfamily)
MKWKAEDLGDADTDGRDVYSPAANRSFRIAAGGRDVGGKADDCRFVYTKVEGDFTLTARLIERAGRVFKTGLMMREDKGKDEQAVALTLGEYGYRQCRFYIRAKKGETMSRQLGNDYTWSPVWFRIQREGNTFIASQSSDGIEWFPVGTGTAEMSDNYLVGLVAAEGESSSDDPLFVTFDHVTLERTPPAPPAAPADLAATTQSEGRIELTWTNTAENQAGFKVEVSTDGELFYEIADLAAAATAFVNTGLSNPTNNTYRVRAYNSGGHSPYSNTASVGTL